MASVPRSKRDFWNGFALTAPDFVCIQEIKAQSSDITPSVANPNGLTGYFDCARKKGIPASEYTADTSPIRSYMALAVRNSMLKAVICNATTKISA